MDFLERSINTEVYDIFNHMLFEAVHDRVKVNAGEIGSGKVPKQLIFVLDRLVAERDAMGVEIVWWMSPKVGR